MSIIFINYRRADAEGDAGRLHDELSRRLPGVQLFMDVNNIGPGDEFADVLDRTLEATDLMLVVIGKSWSQIIDRHRRRRLDDPDDYVRREIVRALELQVRVIPVLVQGTDLPTESELPEPLKKLRGRHAVELRHQRYGDDVKNLVDAIRMALGSPREGQRSFWQDLNLRRLHAHWRWIAPVVVVVAAYAFDIPRTIGPEEPTFQEIVFEPYYADALPAGAVNMAYTPTIVQASGGRPPLYWSVTPNLPAGLSLDPHTGTISGTPTAAFSGRFTFTVRDSSRPPVSSVANLTLQIR